jgi:hypothetical protein
MMRRLLVLNLTLVAVLIAATVRFYSDWMSFQATHQPGAIQPGRETIPGLASVPAPIPPVAEEWSDISSRNPFSFDRTDVPVLEPAAPPKPSAARPILFGTMSLGAEPLAMVASGQTPGNRNYRPMKVGEVIDGWTIRKILDKSIVVESNEIEESVLMSDPSAQIQRDYTRTGPAATPPVATNQPQAPAASPLTSPPPAQSSPTPTSRRRILQQTPFGVREIEVDE